jgi:hypothetical protein
MAMQSTRRRFGIYVLLLVFGGIAYMDRVNMSVAGKPIPQELGLSPISLCDGAAEAMMCGNGEASMVQRDTMMRSLLPPRRVR